MARFSPIARLVMILGIIGLVFAPLPVFVGGVAMASDQVVMAAGMECCPSDTPSNSGCQKTCPFIALCLVKCFSGLAANGALLARRWTSPGVIYPVSDDLLVVRDLRPPAPPPRLSDIAGA